jgi:hypothetical protein
MAGLYPPALQPKVKVFPAIAAYTEVRSNNNLFVADLRVRKVPPYIRWLFDCNSRPLQNTSLKGKSRENNKFPPP